MKVIISTFLLGLSFGLGPCLAGCGPLFLAYVAGTGKGVFKSIKAYFLFSASRVFVYLVLGLLFFIFGRFVFMKLGYLSKFILAGAGLFVISLGILMSLGKGMNSGLCAFLKKHFLEKDRKSVIILGIFTGLLPCAPLMTMLTFTGLTAKSALENLLYSLAFGLGTVISPLVLLAGLAGFLPVFIRDGSIADGLKNRSTPFRLFNIICGLIMIFLGVQLIRRIF